MKGRLYAASPVDTAEEAVQRVEREEAAADAERKAMAERMRERRLAERERKAEADAEAMNGWAGPVSADELAGTGVGRFSGSEVKNALNVARKWMRQHVGTDDRQDRGLSNKDERRRDAARDEEADPEDIYDPETEDAGEDTEEEHGTAPREHWSGWTKSLEVSAENIRDLAEDSPEEFAEHVANLKQLCMIMDSYKSLYGPLRAMAKSATRLLKVFGFVYARENTWVTGRTKACPSCGHGALVQEAIMDPGEWLVICPHCMTRSVAEKGPLHAVKAWNEGRYTDDSEMLMYVGREHAKRAGRTHRKEDEEE